MSGKTIALVGSGIGIVVAIVGGFALLQEDTSGRPRPTPGLPSTNQTNVPKPNVPTLQTPENNPQPPPPPIKPVGPKVGNGTRTPPPPPPPKVGPTENTPPTTGQRA
ncbi:MAG: hypothetical protein ACAI25_03365, partial [Planctomycetota bacterium]